MWAGAMQVAVNSRPSWKRNLWARATICQTFDHPFPFVLLLL